MSGLGKSIDFTLAGVSSEKGLWITTSITLRETCYKIADVYFGHSTHEHNRWIMDGSADFPFFSLSALLRSLCHSAKQALYCGLFIPHPFSTRAPRPRPLPIGMPMPWPRNCKFWLFWSHSIQQIVWVCISILNILQICIYRNHTILTIDSCQIVKLYAGCLPFAFSFRSPLRLLTLP